MVLSLALRYLSLIERGLDGRLRLLPLSQSKALSPVLGLSIGCMVLVVVLSIVNGFEREMRERVLGVLPHVTLHHYYGVKDWHKQKQILLSEHSYTQPLAVAPLESFQALLISDKALAAIQVKGVLPEAEQNVSIIDELMSQGRLESLNDEKYGILLGSKLARKLDLGRGDSLRLMLPQTRLSLVGALPRYRKFTVVGIFEIGAVLDEQLAYIHIDAAGKLLKKKDRVSSLRLAMPDLFSAPWNGWELAQLLNERSDDDEELWASSDWTKSQGSLYEIIVMTKSMLGLLVLLIVLVASFNLASGMIMLVGEKRSDIAILLSQGISSRQITWVFVIQAILIAIIGLTIGIIGAVLLLEFLGSWVSGLERLLDVDLTSAYPVHYLPSEILFEDLIFVSASVLVLSLVASIYPARQAAKVNPAEELKYE